VTGRRNPGQPLYGQGNDKVLRLALLQEWGNECYWCGIPLNHQSAQIDHIIPRSVPRPRLAQLIHKHQLSPHFHLDSPANLAPICAPCNNRKRDRDYLAAAIVYEKLLAAGQRASAVARRYHAFFTNGRVGRALIEVATADLSHPAARGEFLEHAPAIVQTLALLDEARTDFVVDRSFGLPFGESGHFSLALDGRARARYSWVQEICGRPWSRLLDAGMGTLARHVDALFEQGVTGECGPTATALEHSTDRVTATMTITDLRRDGAVMTCEVGGRLEAHYTALVHDADPTDPDGGTLHIHFEAEARSKFLITVSWDLTADPSVVPATEVALTDTEIDAFADRRWK
jgi:hypothetical protein